LETREVGGAPVGSACTYAVSETHDGSAGSLRGPPTSVNLTRWSAGVKRSRFSECMVSAWFEEPSPLGDIVAHARFATELGVAIDVGESLHAHAEFERPLSGKVEGQGARSRGYPHPDCAELSPRDRVRPRGGSVRIPLRRRGR
jgi:hypothetical protein